MTLEENIFFAKRNLVDTIWKSARLEGVNVTFPETQMIIDGYSVANKTIEELTLILNLKRAWQFLFESINEEINLNSIQDFNRIIGRDLIYKSGFLRTADVKISGTNYKPKLPIDYEITNNIKQILENESKKDVALDLMLYIMRSQLFFDGNKRTAMLIANKILIQNGLGILAVRQENMNDFFTKLILFYESNDSKQIKKFCNSHCIETMNFLEEKQTKRFYSTINALNEAIQTTIHNDSTAMNEFRKEHFEKEASAKQEAKEQDTKNKLRRKK